MRDQAYVPIRTELRREDELSAIIRLCRVGAAPAAAQSQQGNFLGTNLGERRLRH
jgi:hypothetical protein